MTTPVSPRSTSAQLASASGLFQTIQAKASFLCVGLDPDPAKIPAAFGTGVAAMEAFCSAVVEATLPYTVAYKLTWRSSNNTGPKDGPPWSGRGQHSLRRVGHRRRQARRHWQHSLEVRPSFVHRPGADAVTVAPTWGVTAWSLSLHSPTSGPCCWRSRPTPAPRISSSTARRRCLKTCCPNPKRLKGPIG